MSGKIDPKIIEKAQSWLDGKYDEDTKNQVKKLMESDPKELTESFYKDLEFGTGGLRGIMGVGTNRMNIYTVGMATQGLSNYLKKNFKDVQIKVAISHDSRNNSRKFAEHVADIFASNNFIVYLFDDLRPTPELSFAIRELGCQSGVMVTASHNPKEYNGYKAYWDDGSQVTTPHDVNIIDEVAKITDISQILSGKNKDNIQIIGEEMDKLYLDRVHSLSLAPEAVKKYHDTKIVYTPIHGAGYKMVPAALRKFGFTNISVVEEQSVLDGNFPTVESPNPEMPATMKMALDLAEKVKAQIVLATDPDADRIAFGVPNEKGEYVLLNGNQTCVLLTYYLCRRWKELGKLDGKQYIIKTIVTSEMMAKVAESYGVKHYNCLTGFKHIAAIIRDHEERKTGWKYIGGGEESFGYLPQDFVRDKDGVSSCSLAAECTAWARSMGMSMIDLLKQMYMDLGFYREAQVSIVRKGIQGADEIKQMMSDYRANPPKSILGSPVVTIKDYQSSEELDVKSGKIKPIDIEESNVLQFIAEDETIISIRPSGTEPKIKFYFGVLGELPSEDKYYEVKAELDAKIESIKKELKLI